MLKVILLPIVLLILFPGRVSEQEYQVKYIIKKVVLCDSLKVDVTWYTSSTRETDSTPFVTADGSKVRDGIIAVSRDLLDFFTYGDSLFIGGTDEKNCASKLRGASYATSEVKISDSYLYSWDRGFDKEGKQVWGAQKGGYYFKRVK